MDLLLSKKVKVNALKTKPSKKEQHYKLKHTAREQRAKEPQIRDYSVDSESTLANFAKRHIGVELSQDLSSDDDNDNKKPSGKGNYKSSGKDFVSKRGNQKPDIETFFDCYGIDVAPIHLFKNQVIPVRIHNISKSLKHIWIRFAFYC